LEDGSYVKNECAIGFLLSYSEHSFELTTAQKDKKRIFISAPN